MNKTLNASRNIFFGVLLRIYQLAFPFALRTIMVYTIGIEYLGLNTLFTSVLGVLNLAELGVGSAMVFSMYKPIAEDDTTTICALMKLYRLYYRIIGSVILILGLCLLPFIDQLIEGDVPKNINVYTLYLLNLFATVLSYWLFAYRNSILQANQRTDVYSKVTLITDTGKYLLQITALLVLKNYYAFIIIALFTQICNNILTAHFSKKLFPQYNPNGDISLQERKKINRKIKDLFTSKLGYTIVHSADTIIISAFLGLTALAQYQNYYFIMTSIVGFISIIYTSITAGIGNSIIVKSLDENYKEFEILTLLVTWVCGICCSCFVVLYQPFMKWWMGSENLLSNGIVVLLCIYFWLYELVMMISMYKDAGGIWHEDRFRPLISGLVNLITNIILVKYIGLFGVVLSTILSMLIISIPWIIHNVFKLLFKRKPTEYIIKLLLYTVIIIVTSAATYFLCKGITDDSIIALLFKGFAAGIISILIMVGLLWKSPNFKPATRILFSITRLDRIINKYKKNNGTH